MAKLRITYGSDLHLEMYTFLRHELFEVDLDFLLPPKNGDVLVLAGDICTYQALMEDGGIGRASGFLRKLGYMFDHVLWVPGNHENWSSDLTVEEGVEWLRDFLASVGGLENYQVLSQDSVKIGGVNFLGTMLWSDMSGTMLNEAASEMVSAPDFCEVYTAPGGVIMNTVSWTARHKDDVRWLVREFRKLPREDNRLLARFVRDVDLFPFKEPVVVVTHCSPTYRTEAKFFAKSIGSQLFYTALDGYLAPGGKLSGARYWIHGHTHTPKTTKLGHLKILCNPVGYPRKRGWEAFPTPLINQKFKWGQVTI